MLDSIGVHICELVKIDDAPSSKPTQPTFKKFVNFQYNMLGCLDDGINESSTKCLMFQVF